MTLQKITPLVLLIFTVLCALPAAAAAMIPSAIAQEDDDDYDDSLDDDYDDSLDDDYDDQQDLANGIVSEVIEEDGDAADDDENYLDSTNTATINPNQEQDLDQTDLNVFGDETADVTGDQRAANVAVPIGIPIDIDVIEEAPPTTLTPPEEEEPPEFAAFCFVSGVVGEPVLLCWDTFEDCQLGEGVFGPAIEMCAGVVTVPPEAGDCEVLRDEEGEPTAFICDLSST
jgi:hypothetical protein